MRGLHQLRLLRPCLRGRPRSRERKRLPTPFLLRPLFFSSPRGKWFRSIYDSKREARRAILGPDGIFWLKTFLMKAEGGHGGFGIPRYLQFMLPGVPEK